MITPRTIANPKANTTRRRVAIICAGNSPDAVSDKINAQTALGPGKTVGSAPSHAAPAQMPTSPAREVKMTPKGAEDTGSDILQACHEMDRRQMLKWAISDLSRMSRRNFDDYGLLDGNQSFNIQATGVSVDLD
jgi:hypothetical protein